MVRLASSAGGIFVRSKLALGAVLIVWAGMALAPERASAWASEYNSTIEQLRGLSVDYGSEGMICEQVARLDLYKTHFDPREYLIEIGIMYGSYGNIQGELDIVVFHRRSGRVVMVGEVKCSSNLQRASQSARKQRNRFRDAVERGRIQLWRDEKRFSIEAFREIDEYWLIAQKGSANNGFDLELSISLKEAHELREAMIECQRVGYCKSPRRGHQFFWQIDKMAPEQVIFAP